MGKSGGKLVGVWVFWNFWGVVDAGMKIFDVLGSFREKLKKIWQKVVSLESFCGGRLKVEGIWVF